MMAFFLAFSSLAGTLGKASTIHARRRLFFFFFFRSGDQIAHTNLTFWDRISPQWLSQLRRLWPNVPDEFACALVSLKSAHTMPGQHSQPTPTSSQPPRVISGLIATYNRDNINITCKQNLNDNSQLYLHLQPLWNWPYAQKTWCRSDGDWHIQGIQSDNPVLAKHKNVRFFFFFFFNSV